MTIFSIDPPPSTYTNSPFTEKNGGDSEQKNYPFMTSQVNIILLSYFESAFYKINGIVKVNIFNGM
jgi:hypothetical protein